MQTVIWKPTLAEFIGTFTLVFIGGAGVAAAGTQGVTAAALSHGLILVALIYIFGPISGAHVNPAVTAGLLVGGHITLNLAFFYWIAQFAGGLAAALIVGLALGDPGPTIGLLTNPAGMLGAVVFEFILTFFLVTTIYQAALYAKAGNLAPIAIGFTLAACIFAGGIFTGASLNPARTLGPAIVDGRFDYVLPYLFAIFLGGIAAGLFHHHILKPDDTGE